MVKYKLNISVPEEGKTTTMEIDEPQSLALEGKKIGDTIDGSLLDLSWKRLMITGGSDSSGFPLRPDIGGGVKKGVLLSGGVGLKKVKRRGYRKRKTIRGSIVTRDTYQINLKVVER